MVFPHCFLVGWPACREWLAPRVAGQGGHPFAFDREASTARPWTRTLYQKGGTRAWAFSRQHANSLHVWGRGPRHYQDPRAGEYAQRWSKFRRTTAMAQAWLSVGMITPRGHVCLVLGDCMVLHLQVLDRPTFSVGNLHYSSSLEFQTNKLMHDLGDISRRQVNLYNG